METPRFDSLVRALGEGGTTRRTLTGLLGGALLAALPIAGEAKKKKKKKKKKCKPDSTAVTCNGTCGSVTNNCKQAVNCGSCACKNTCGVCFTCKEGPNTPGTCGVDQKKVGTSCGSPGQKCQPDGACTCTSHSDCGAKEICDNGSCETCDVCPGAGNCTYKTPQEAIDVGWPGATEPITVRICPGTYGSIYKDSYTPDVTLIGAGDGDDPASNTILDGPENSDPDHPGWVARFEGGGTSTLRGVRVTGGIIGGLYNNDHTTLNLTNCTISGNSSLNSVPGGGHGGGISNASTLLVTNVAVAHNTADDRGAGIFNFASDGGTIAFSGDNLIAGNVLEAGGDGGSAIYNQGTSSSISGLGTVTFQGNDPETDQCHNCP